MDALSTARRAAEECALPLTNPIHIVDFGFHYSSYSIMSHIVENISHRISHRPHFPFHSCSIKDPEFVVSHVVDSQADFDHICKSREGYLYHLQSTKPGEGRGKTWKRKRKTFLSKPPSPPATPPKDKETQTEIQCGNGDTTVAGNKVPFHHDKEDVKELEIHVNLEGVDGAGDIVLEIEDPHGSIQEEEQHEKHSDGTHKSNLSWMNVYPFVVIRPVFERLFPANHIQLGFSFDSLHRLSKLPPHKGPPLSPLAFSPHTPRLQRLPFSIRAHHDLLLFLHLRAQEFVPMGQLLITFPAVEDAQSGACEVMTGALDEAVDACVEEGILTSRERDFLGVAMHFRSVEEVKETLLSQTQWKTLEFRLERMCSPGWSQFERGQWTEKEYAEECVKSTAWWAGDVHHGMLTGLLNRKVDRERAETIVAEICKKWTISLFSRPPEPHAYFMAILRLVRVEPRRKVRVKRGKLWLDRLLKQRSSIF
ncbi:uncharacterized protein VTP21DRAFT_329 [Calcarisporiella thermophila]|uniref:uncharacterized protein n=1 Tax=Calcarisporiella thermophila TaxID=911321 RepID=UPI00374481F7